MKSQRSSTVPYSTVVSGNSSSVCWPRTMPTTMAMIVGVLLLVTVAVSTADQSTNCAASGSAEGSSSQREGRSAQQEAASLATAQRSLLRMLPKAEKPRCRWQAEECNPYTLKCCQGMRCANYMGGYCMASYEKCICFPSQSPGDSN